MTRFLLAAWILSGWPILSLCLERQYFFISSLMNWTDAQSYCRKQYTDLATIGGSEDMKQFLDLLSTDGNGSEVWIGLYSEIDWRWSDGQRKSSPEYRNWETSDGDPDFISANQFCVCIGDNGRWWDYNCEKEFPFICYKAISGGTEFKVVDEAMSWSRAWTYCQQNFSDLANIGTSSENQRVQTLVPTGYWAWTGLFRSENIYWSDQSSLEFTNWDHISNPIGSMDIICGATSQSRSLKWRFLSCQTMLPFVCYRFRKRVMKRVVKLTLKSEKPFNLMNPEQKAKILEMLQNKLNESAPLKYMEQPNGEIFWKETNKTRKKTEL